MISSQIRTMLRPVLWLMIAGLASCAEAQSSFEIFKSPTVSYHLVRSYSIGGSYTWQGIALDSEQRRIYLAHYNRVEVVDEDSGSRVSDILETPDVRAIAIASDLNRGFTANGGADARRTGDSGSVTVFDTTTLKALARVAVNPPESIVYDLLTHRVFPLNQKTTVIDGRSNEKVGEVDLGGQPSGALSDGRGTVFVNLSDKRALAVIDAKTLQVSKVFPIHCAGPHSLAYDSREQRLFIGCDDGHLYVIDAVTGKFVNRVQMCSGVDGSGYDPDARLVFQACDEGVISVIHENATDAYDIIDTVKTALWASAMAFDPKTKAIYLPTADYVPIPGKDDPTRERLAPGTFRLLLVSP